MTAPREEPRLQPDMEDPTDLAAPFELEIKDLGDRRREYTYKTDPYQGTRSRVTTIWKRKSYFAHKDGEIYPMVYLDESGDGRLRVVKEIVPRKIDGGNRYSELETMFRVINTVGPDYSRLFVEFLGWFESSCGLSLVLEYCALGDIDQCFAEPVPEQVAKTVAGQLLEGIAALHRLGITHRDIKPENVLVAQKDPVWVKIADFGVSKYTDDKTQLRTSQVGTPRYKAPELLFDTTSEGFRYSNSVDVWSLGYLLYYMLTKKFAFPDFDSLRSFYHGDARYPDSLLIQKGVGRSGIAFLRSLMDPVPDNRPKACIDLLAQWELCMGGEQQARHQPTEDVNEITGTSEGAFTQVFDLPPALSLLNTNRRGPPSINQLPIDYWTSELFSTIQAAREGDTRRIRAILDERADPNRMQNGLTALHHAAKQGSAEIVELLLEYDADTSMKTHVHKETALHLATHRGDSEAFLKILHLIHNRGVDIDAQDTSGNTVLHLAIARLSIHAVQALLGLKARTDQLGRGGLAPLHYALKLDREDKARILLDNDADPNIPGPNGRRPLHEAVASRRISLQLIGQIVEKGANINEKDDDGVSPFHEAVRQDRPDVVHFLIGRGADCILGSSRMEKRLQWMNFRRGLPWPLGN